MYPNYVRVEFLYEWMGNPKNSQLTILETAARHLEGRGTVRILKIDEVDKNSQEDLQAKELENPPMHKMVEKSPKTKNIERSIKARGR